MAERSYLEEAVRYDYSRKFVKSYTGAVSSVRALIAVDKESTVFQKALLEGRRIHFCVGDIQERDSLKLFEGK
ncbi:hypothetical protein TNCT_436401, partial [Trichonephila clavata]